MQNIGEILEVFYGRKEAFLREKKGHMKSYAPFEIEVLFSVIGLRLFEGAALGIQHIGVAE